MCDLLYQPFLTVLTSGAIATDVRNINILFGNIKPEEPLRRYHPCILHLTVFRIVEKAPVFCSAQVKIQNYAGPCVT